MAGCCENKSCTLEAMRTSHGRMLRQPITSLHSQTN